MNKLGYVSLAATCALLSLASVLSSCGGSDDPTTMPGAALPSANDLPETALQGQVPIADQLSGRSTLGYRKGMVLVSQNTLLDRGSNMQMAWYKNCAYVGNGSAVNHPLEGMAVLNVSEPAAPKLIRIVSSVTGANGWEGLEVSQQKGYLISFAASRTNPINTFLPSIAGAYADAFDVYDVSQNCDNPILVATVNTRALLPAGMHGLKISPDGRTVYISAFQSGTGDRASSPTTLAAYDLSTPSQPKHIASWAWSNNPAETVDFGFHDGSISNDGKTLFFGTSLAVSRLSPNNISKIAIQAFDVSSIQDRAANSRFDLIGAVNIRDCGGGQVHTVQYARVGGKAYVFAGGECPGVQLKAIDVSDPTKMVIVSTYDLESSAPSNAAKVSADNVNYTAHYSGVDDSANASALFMTWYGSGLRALDIRDPAHIKEFAYLNPPAHPNNVFCGFACATKHEMLMSDVRYDATTGNIWFAGVNGGFYVAQITQSAGSNGLAKSK